MTLFFHASIHSLTATFVVAEKGRIENYGNEKGSQKSGKETCKEGRKKEVSNNH
ncbi:MAG: hypothetical protein WA419_03490 [Silvibacterium sp.]